MQSTGQASTQAVSLVPMQGSAITYVIKVPISRWRISETKLYSRNRKRRVASNSTPQSSRCKLGGRGNWLYPTAGKHVLEEAQNLAGEQTVGGHHFLAIQTKRRAVEAEHFSSR